MYRKICVSLILSVSAMIDSLLFWIDNFNIVRCYIAFIVLMHPNEINVSFIADIILSI